MTTPTDSRLPGGGGYVVNNLYNVVPSKFGLTSNNITDANNFGSQYMHYNGFLVNFTARNMHGLTLQGGVNTGKTVQDDCAIRNALPELVTTAFAGTNPIVAPLNPYCHVDPGFITKANAIASYIIPKVDVLIASTFRTDQGAPLSVTWNAPTATVVNPALGRTISGGAATAAIVINAPGNIWGDRVNELDFRFGKILKFGRMRINAGIDVYNILNQAAVLSYNQTFGASLLAPTAVLSPRFMKLSAQIDF